MTVNESHEQNVKTPFVRHSIVAYRSSISFVDFSPISIIVYYFSIQKKNLMEKNLSEFCHRFALFFINPHRFYVELFSVTGLWLGLTNDHHFKIGHMTWNVAVLSCHVRHEGNIKIFFEQLTVSKNLVIWHDSHEKRPYILLTTL